MKDLIIGATTKYVKHQLFNYVESIKRCGFTGDKIMVVYDTDDDTIKYLKSEGWEIFKGELEGHIHMHRLITMYWVLRQLDRDYRYMITTDVRDVVFQHNPSDWLEKNLKKDILVSSENLLYKHCNWGPKNILEGYNELLLDRYENEQTCNVGVLAGKYESMRDLLLLNYLVSQAGNTEHFTDQSSFNFIVHNKIAKSNMQFTTLGENWALQIGTLHGWPNPNNDKIIGEQNHELNEYVILHQYDRVPAIDNHVNKLLS